MSGCGFFETDSFGECLDSVWRRMSVSTDESEINPNNAAICRGAQSLDYRWRLIARRSRIEQGRQESTPPSAKDKALIRKGGLAMTDAQGVVSPSLRGQFDALASTWDAEHGPASTAVRHALAWLHFN